MKRRNLSQRAIDRANSEVAMPDPAALERFKAAHDGMTPIQFALSKFPSAERAVGKVWPHLVRKPK